MRTVVKFIALVSALIISNVSFASSLIDRFKSFNPATDPELISEALDIKDPGMCLWVAGVGSTLSMHKDYSQAIEVLQHAASICKEPSGIANAYFHLSTVYTQLEDWDKVELSISKQVQAYGGEDNLQEYVKPMISSTRMWLHKGKGDVEKALHFSNKTLKLYGDAYGSFSMQYLMQASLHGMMLNDSKQYKKAKKILKKNISAIKEFGTNNVAMASYSKTMIVMAKMQLAFSYLKMKQYEKSKEIYEELVSDSDENLSLVGVNLAYVYEKLGDLSSAIKFYEETLKYAEKMGSKKSEMYHISLLGLFLAQVRNGDMNDALESMRKLVDIEEEILSKAYYLRLASHQSAVVKQYITSYHSVLSMVNTYYEHDEKIIKFAYELMLNRKGLLFDIQSLQLEAAAVNLNPRDKKIWKKIVSIQTKIKKIESEASNPELTSSLRDEVNELEIKLSKTNNKISQHIKRVKVSLQSVASKMPNDTLLIEFVKVQDYGWKLGEWTDNSRYIAFTIDGNKNVELIDFGKASIIDKEITKLGKQLDIELEIINGRSNPKIYSKLYSSLLDPILKSKTNIKSLIISLDGEINLVPFGALRLPNGKHLIEDYTVYYVNSGRDLVRKNARNKSNNELFLAANPSFNGKVGKNNSSKIIVPKLRMAEKLGTFESLPGTSEEAKIIPKILSNGKSTVLTKSQATESAVMSAKRPRVMHLATHGFFKGNVASNQPIRLIDLGVGKSSTLNAINPLLNSGLAFSGANMSHKAKGSNDGLLTALEVTSMDLQGTDLVTLSACETGIGKISNGDGVYGLRRAFALAGANSLLMSLWPVSDEVAAYQMEKFYTEYSAGKSSASSLRSAKISTIKWLNDEYGEAPPAYWAPFIVQGGFQ